MVQPEEPVVDALAEEWDALSSLGSMLEDLEWDLPSECPGWTVRDLMSHMIGTERSLLGDEAPAAPDHPPDHVHNAMGASNEAWVAPRRSLPGAVVLAEFVEVTHRRLAQLRQLAPERFEDLVPSPAGTVPYREFMDVRLMDCWVHEQDIRVATGRPGHGGGAVAQLALGRLVAAMPFVVGKRAAAPEGSWVRFDLMGPPDRRLDVAVRDGRAGLVDSAEPGTSTSGGVIRTGDADAVLTMDIEVFWRLACGRVEPEAALSADLVRVVGDTDLGRRVVGGMAFMI